ncbi:MAG: S8 family serine peptidase [Ramlibacter sp.]
MAALIDRPVAAAAQNGETLEVLVLVDSIPAPGAAPLALASNISEKATRTQEVHQRVKRWLYDPMHPPVRAARGMTALALTAALPPPDPNHEDGVLLGNLGALMASVKAADLAKIAAAKGVRKIIAMPRFMPLIAPMGYGVAPPAMLRSGPTDALVQVRAPALWDAGLDGAGVRIGHFDTGINKSHPAFAQLAAGRRLRYAQFDAAGNRVARARAKDSHAEFHGSHTAGTLVAQELDGGMRVGLAPAASLVSVHIFPSNPAPTSRQRDQLVVNALNWIVGERPDVINLSFGDSRYNDSYLGIIEELIDQNIVVVAAVGNQGPRTSASPGNYANVISVGAVTARNAVCGFSGSARVRNKDRPDICAPGEKILSAGGADTMAVCDGTSMAAPHVAGICALLKQRAPELSPAQLKDLLLQTAHRPAGWDAKRGGAGIVHAQRALSGL